MLLYFQLSDMDNERWEVPDSLVDLSASRDQVIDSVLDAEYSVIVQDQPFALKIFPYNEYETPL